MNTKAKVTCVAAMVAALMGGSALANEGDVPHGVPHLDHVFVIMMENHGYQQIVNNPNQVYLNSLIASKSVNLAQNYFAVGHPSLTNYLEVVGGSNFGIRSDNSPSWHNATCAPNLATGSINADNGAGLPVTTATATTGTITTPLGETVTIDTVSAVCPISGSGHDGDTDAIDSWNEVAPPYFAYLANLDGLKSVTLGKHAEISGASIADQLAEHGASWKAYEESLPLVGADGVNYSNGTATNSSNFGTTGVNPLATGSLALTSGSVVQAYAVKHNPFAYFKSVQEGTSPELSLANVVGFDGAKGLYADLATGNVPSFSYIVPNQCNDQHGRGNADAFCAFDPGLPADSGSTVGTQVQLNPALIAQGDVTIQRLVTSIKASPVWKEGHNAIVIVWDENDYSGLPALPAAGAAFPLANQNNVVVTVEPNDLQAGAGIVSTKYFNHFSLLRSIEGGLGLPCLNHACDEGVAAMGELFR